MEDEDETNPSFDNDSLDDTELIYDTIDEDETIEEEVGDENQISSPRFVITKIGDYNVLDEFSGIFIFL